VTPRAPAAAAPEPRERGKRAEKGAARGQQAPQTPATMVSAIAEKDLFDPTRRAPTEETKPAEVVRETGPPPGVTVTGVRIVGKDREALLTEASAGNQQKRLRVGDQVAGYTVKAIEAAGITLTSPSGDPVTMALVPEKGKSAPRPPTPPKPANQQGAPPSAGVSGTSPAAGVQSKPPPPPPAPAAPPPPAAAAQGQTPQLPTEVRQRLERLKESEGGRPGRKR
jgi:hypothetical protein